jgi:DnaA family protein
MRQLPLQILTLPEPTFESFIASGNDEAVASVRAVAMGAPGQSALYLWGAAGSGRTHLLRSAARKSGGLYVPPGQPVSPGDFPLYAVDDVQVLDSTSQIALFNLINMSREGITRVLVSGSCAHTHLRLREDLRSRLGWGLTYRLRSLADEQKKALLRAHAALLGIAMTDDVIEFVFARFPRDLWSLDRILDHLDRETLARRRTLTMPLVRAALEKFELPPSSASDKSIG